MQANNPNIFQIVASSDGVKGYNFAVATDEQKKSLGAAVLRLREDRAMSQDELGALIAKNGQTISNIETGKVFPRGETYRGLAKGLGLSVDELNREWQGHRWVKLSREVYDSVKAAADYHQAGIEDWISMTAGTHKVTAPGKPPVNPRPPKASARRAGTHRRTPR